MADPRFYRREGPFALGELARVAGARLVGGNETLAIDDVAPLESAGGGHLTFLDNVKYLGAARGTGAAACLIRAEQAATLPAGVARLLIEDPYRGYARVAARFYPGDASPDPAWAPSTGVAPEATLDPSATIGAACRVDPGAVVGAGVELGPRCRIGANAVLGRGVVLGPDCVIGAGATLSHCVLGARVVVHAGARIGQDGFGFALGPEGHLKVPQIGRVVIDDDVEIGSNSTIDRGSGPDTLIGRGCKIDNLVMIAHNVQLGAGCVVVAQAGVSGSTRIGAGSVLAAQVGVVGHLTIGPGVRLAARTAVTRDLAAHGTYGGVPAVPIGEWRRQVAAVRRLGRQRTATNE